MEDKVGMVLEGVRVVDWSIFQVGPFAGAMLADLGADVIHLEELGKGDRLRGLQSFLGLRTTLPGGRHIHFEEHNRNKKSLAIDLRQEGGREAVYRLVAKSDVFLTNLRPATVKAVGMDYETLSRHNPRLIYASASGFGSRGPDAALPSIDIIGCARSGSMWGCSAGGDTPVLLTPGIGDRIASIHLAYGVLAALLARDKYGVGQEVKTSQLGSMIALQGFGIMPPILLEKEYPRHERTRPGNALYNYYRCQDGRWIVVGMIEKRYWKPFCEAIGEPELAVDPRFATDEGRSQHRELLVEILDRVFATKTCGEWCELFKQRDFLFSPVNTYSDLAHDEQVLANDYITTWDHPVLGPTKFVGFPIEMEATPLTLRSAAPECGQHTEEILTEVCGYSWEEVADLREGGAI